MEVQCSQACYSTLISGKDNKMANLVDVDKQHHLFSLEHNNIFDLCGNKVDQNFGKEDL